MRSVSLHIHGRVQGVWFRASAKSIAAQLHIRGFVVNTPVGSVYIEATGDPVAIENFIAWCRTGPELARVDNVEVSEIPLRNFSTFEIRRH